MYHIIKRSRDYHGYAYCGPTSANKPAEYEDIESAIKAQQEFTNKNPVGWDIYDSETGEKIQQL